MVKICLICCALIYSFFGEIMDPYDDDDCAYMGDDWPDDYDPDYEPEADYYPEPLYGQ